MSNNNNNDKDLINVYPGPPKSAFDLHDEELTDEEEDEVPSARSILARTKERTSSPSVASDSSLSRHEKVRADALQLLQMANDKSSTRSPGWSDNNSDDDFEDENIVNVVSMGSRMTRTPSSDLDTIVIQEEEKEEAPLKGGRWSNRYSVNSTLTRIQGPLGNSHDTPDEENAPKSANNMYRSRAPPTPIATKMGSLMRNFTERFENEDEELTAAVSPNSRVSLLKSMWTNTKARDSPTVWCNVNLADHSKALPDIPFDSRSEKEVLRERRSRNNKCILYIVFIGAITLIIIGSAIAYQKPGGSPDPSSSATTSTASFNPSLTFVITADTYRPADESFLNDQLYNLPKDASFLVHLGDLSQSKTSLCTRSIYSDASSLLKASSLVTFVLPGEEDWNNCPKPSTALTYWRENLGSFEKNFELKDMPPIEHAFNRVENFAFFWDGILVLGLNLVDGTVQSEEEWSKRHIENVQFTEQNLHNYRLELKAVLLFGHARPSAKIGDYFWPICEQIKSFDIPMLYLYGSSKEQETLLTYQPFTHTPNLYAAPTRPHNPDVGSPFIKVKIDLNKIGEDMFQFEQL